MRRRLRPLMTRASVAGALVAFGAVAAGPAMGAPAAGTTTTTSPTLPAKIAPYRPPPTLTVDEGLLPSEADAWPQLVRLRDRAARG